MIRNLLRIGVLFLSRRLIILAHGDSDGVAAAAITIAALRDNYNDIKVYFSHPAGLYGDLNEFYSSGFDVVILDIALSELHLSDLLKMFKAITKKNNLVYIDHHPEPLGIHVKEIPGQVFHRLDASTSELTYRFFEEYLDPDMVRVALYGAISDYLDETPWVKEMLEYWDKRDIYYEAGVLSQGLEGSRRLHDFKRHVVRHLSENRLPSSLSELLVRALIESVNNEELRKWVKKNVIKRNGFAYVIDPPGSLGRAATYSRAVTNAPVGVAISRRKRLAEMSLRAKRNTVDLNFILRKITPRLHGSGGGHSFAAGARIPLEHLDEFLRELESELEKIRE